MFISEYSRDEAWENEITGLAYGTYDYVADPAKAVGLFQNAVAEGNTINTLENLKRLANNDAITETLFNRIIFPTGTSYRVIVFGKNSAGRLFGKYVGYSTDGKAFTYWHPDPASANFRKKGTKATNNN